MKKGLLYLIVSLLSLPLTGQFKVLDKGHQHTGLRTEVIGEVTNIRENNPQSGNLPESALFTFEAFGKQSIELGNISQVKVIWSQERDIPLAIYGKSGPDPDTDLSMEERCYQYLESVREYLGVDEVRNRFFIREILEDDNGLTHIKLKQHYRGIPIYGGEIIVHFRDKQPYFMNGYWYPEKTSHTEEVSFRNTLDVKSIVRNDLSQITRFRNLSRFETELIHGSQWQIEKIYYQPDGSETLVPGWYVSVHPNIGEEWKYILENRSGKILKRFQSVCRLHPHPVKGNHIPDPSGSEKAWADDLSGTNRELNVYNHLGKYYLIDASRTMFSSGQSQMPDEPVGVIWTLDARNTSPETNDFYVEQITSNNNNWSNETAVSAHYNSQTAYEYYLNTFGRNSINGQGGNIISLINVVNSDGSHMDNAFWSGKAMFYGNGKDAFKPLAGSLDVAGHEMTHGVIQSTANLEYYGEPGAINESYADIFGCMIDRDDWQLGEDVVFPHVFTSGALRDMSDPHNGGSSLNDLGYQPKHVNEQYLGQEDNAGVHINSGIPNHAFYLFATAVGKNKAEQIYYKALTSYLTRSSKFVDLRLAIEQAAYDMYGAAEKQAASDAFHAVGISGGSGGGSDYQNDLAVNPGSDFILFKDDTWNELVLGAGDGSILAEPFSSTSVLSKPSVSDNGSEIVFVGQDRKIHYIFIDWNTLQYEENIIQNEPIWRNVIISKDGWRIAALTESLDNQIHVYDFGLAEWKSYEVYNPSTVQGVNAGPVDFVDVMEFNYSGEWIMYDAQNTINSEFGSDIEYWDIGFIQVFNNTTKYFGNGLVQKLFTGIPENTSIGNPTFSKNSPYIIAFDYLVGNNEFYILGSNLETGAVNQLYESLSPGYPNYSRMDDQLLFDFSSFFGTDVAALGVGETKIDYIPNSDYILFTDASWGVWFSNGNRELVLSDGLTLQPKTEPVNVSPNPVSDVLNLSGETLSGIYQCRLFNLMGEVFFQGDVSTIEGTISIDLADIQMPTGPYFVSLRNRDQLMTEKVQVFRP
jgi:Zn-dependent metalloprotease